MAIGNKHFCFILNAVILATGIVLIVLGFKARGTKNEIYSENDNDSKLFAAITNDWLSGIAYIIMGAIVSIFAALGFYAAYVEDRMILKYHSVLTLTIITVLFIWIAAFSWFCVSDKDSLKKDFDSAFDKNQSKDEITAFALNYVCCSSKNREEFVKKQKDFPGSCCPVLESGKCSTQPPTDYKTTCADKYADSFKVRLENIKNNYWWMGLTQFVALLSAMGLFWITKNTSDDGFGV